MPGSSRTAAAPDLLPAEVLDPYPRYRRLRERDPVRWEPSLPGWLVPRHDDVHAALRNHERLSPDPIEQLVSCGVPEDLRLLVPARGRRA